MAKSKGRKKTRREFLQVHLGDDTQASIQRDAASDQPANGLQPGGGPLMMHVACRAMATQFEIRFPCAVGGTTGGREHDAQLALETLESLDELEERMSFFRPTSEISRINLLAAEGPFEVEPELFQLLCLARDIWRETEGALDITATPLWQAWGFATRKRVAGAGRVASEEQIADALSRVGFQFVQLDEQHNTIRFSRPGMQLNLGSIGKGYALDRCAAKLIHGGMRHFLLHGGQSSILAHGSDTGQAAECREKNGAGSMPHEIFHNKQDSCEGPVQVCSDFWTIGIPHPWKAGKRIAEIKLRNRAIGTSSSQFQSFRHKGKLYGHIIDPRTGRPAEGLLSATVVAGSSVLADALSTAFFVLGLEKSLAYAQAHPEIATVLLTHSSRGGDVEIHRCGLDDGDFQVF
ncbi:MAG: FAD:protein FMN transferase [Thermoguttaceae bacterium]|jgi:thiamine biosynthesis lipoprotein